MMAADPTLAKVEPMGSKMKGLLKGLRYISQIFDDKEEDEMQIGYPTDVKHVAHVGWDGNSSASPSWMNEYRAGTANGGDALVGLQQLAAGAIADNGDSAAKRDLPSAPAARQSRRSASNASDAGDHAASSPNREARSSGRHQSAGGTADPSATQEHSSGSARHVRRHRSNAGSVTGDGESTDAAKQARRRRSKAAGSGGGGDAKGSTRSTSRLKHQESTTGLESEKQSAEQPRSAAKVAVDDE